MSHILCIETATPEYAHRQQDLARYYCDVAPENDKQTRRRINIVSRQSGIKKRHSVLPDFSERSVNNILFSAGGQKNALPGISERMQVFRREALRLSAAAVNAIKNFGSLRDEVTHLITVTCTGLFAPGLDIELTRELGLRRTVQRSGINFMGCNAALLALKQANQICDSQKDALVLIVCTELCTLHFQRDFSDDYILSNMLFADGSAAALIGSPRPALSGHYRPMRISDFHSLVLSEGFEHMAWQLSEKGFLMNLSSYVSALLNTNMPDVLSENGIDREDIAHWAIHPGGRKILDDFCRTMKLEKEQLSTSYDILENYGNMSSATILFVLRQLANDRKIHAGEKIYSAAFGPGLTVESAIMQYV